MKQASVGVIMTSSVAGIYGNFGQANYSTAKLGLFGLTQTLALEGASKNILVNAIAPTAGSRLTQSVLPLEVVQALKPEYVTPAVILLSHETAQTTGKLFEVGGGWVCQTRWEQTEASISKRCSPPSPWPIDGSRRRRSKTRGTRRRYRSQRWESRNVWRAISGSAPKDPNRAASSAANIEQAGLRTRTPRDRGE